MNHASQGAVNRVSNPCWGCAGVNRHVAGEEESLQERRSDSILTLSLAIAAARLQSKRRQGHRWAGLLSSEKDRSRDADLIPKRGKATQLAA
jgi:hypothetical protein